MPEIYPDIIAETDGFWVINKPIGWTVQRDTDAPSVLQWLQRETAIKPLPVHRLDKPTSGLLLVAKTEQANRELSLAFAERTVRKTYLAVSDCKPKKKQGWVKGDMAPARRGQWKLLRTTENPALTQFSSYLLSPSLRGFVLQPKTGKTHQLRVAMKSLGAPILGDIRYGGSAADRVFLHAWRLEFSYHGAQYSYQQDPNPGDHTAWPFSLPDIS
ncbi:pseudouridine synthase [Reinekea marinisedimentorum]|uniref:tRNA pseudouridine32 synthase / 23S rRNA pseudouridine746 synthase n=1 Tax=Reinekea marinisedimentorum TaxID=230495 RepID=A0A4R3IEN3_9GAMM|nr:pseudouridine synthase [Reinekea marinisedimentorum]TCS44068.1 tRNA pseudouridine32 synthase / 23S rRNA pseudouridine746 synthase [Reinekea marinisedimentorum]